MSTSEAERKRRGPRPLAIGLGAAILCAALALAAAASTAPRAGAAAAGPDFETQIAPLLATHCLTCHGPTVQQGGLDLSRKETAFAGGAGGPAIVPGNPAESPLWRQLEADQMPPAGLPRLTAAEKRLLREWIEAGAVWTGGPLRPGAPPPTPEFWLRRLTLPEYVETVRSALAVEIEPQALRLLPPDVRADGFSNTAYNLTVDLAHVEAYARLAQIAAGQVDAAAFAGRFTESTELSEANLRRLIASKGKWLLRGPLEAAEIEAFLPLPLAVAEQGGDFAEAARALIEAMLQSPRFLYRIEKRPAGGDPRPVSDWELASRLSYMLWGGPPDAELARAAEAGELADRDRAAAQVERMLADPRAAARASRFAREWLDLDRLDGLRPNPRRFPRWHPRLAADMRAETLAFFHHVAWAEQRPLGELMNAQITFLTPHLAHHYGLPLDLKARVSEEGLLALYTFAEGEGDTVRDVSGAGEPLHLQIADPAAVEWGAGRLTLKEGTLIASDGPPRRLIEAVQRSNAVTLEAWLAPANTAQDGPARVLTLSSGTSTRNFTFGQDGDRYDVRFRTSETNVQGQPSLAGPPGSAATRLTHVVYTRAADGQARLYVDGEERAAQQIGGDLGNWDAGFRLALADETSRDRPWLGDYHLVAIYDRALPAAEVRAKVERLERVDLADVPSRGGLLTHGSLLTVGGDDASMVTRGLFLLRDLLFGSVGSAPPGVDTTPVPPEPGQSRRAIAEARLADPSCGPCHGRFEPFAFGLEKYDGLGAFRPVDEHGNELREDGALLFPGAEEPAAYRSTAELLDLLAASERASMNITRKLAQFALGRPLTAADAGAVEAIHAAAQAGGGTYRSLIAALAQSDLLRFTHPPAGPATAAR